MESSIAWILCVLRKGDKRVVRNITEMFMEVTLGH